MKLPLLDDLIDEQLDVYETDPDSSIFVLGPPGSGKTSIAVLRMQQLSNMDRTCLLITKNRLLASLAAQLGKQNLTTFTMNTFISRDHFQRIGSNAPEPAEPFNYDWPTILATYERNNLQPLWDHMVIDEGQNLPAGFFTWAVRFGARAVSVFADEDQTTDPQRSTIEDISAAPLPLPRRLSVNHRNTREIAAVAEHFHHSNRLPAAVVRRPRSGEIPQMISFTQWPQMVTTMSNRLHNRGGSIGVIVYPVSEAENVYRLLKAAIPAPARVDIFTHKTPRLQVQHIKPMEDGITVLTGESAIGLEFDTVYLQDLSRSLPTVSTDQYRRLYMLCARARDSLILLNGQRPLTANQLISLPDSTLLSR